jgi:Rieske Fe-S protein
VLARANGRDIPADSALVFREERVALVRKGEEVYALSLVCTHLGCTVTVADDGLACPCHGSRFDRAGNVTRGPADRPLARLAVRRSGDLVEVLAS